MKSGPSCCAGAPVAAPPASKFASRTAASPRSVSIFTICTTRRYAPVRQWPSSSVISKRNNRLAKFATHFTKISRSEITSHIARRFKMASAKEYSGMAKIFEPVARLSRFGAKSMARLKRDRRGNVAMMFAIMSPILVGGLGMGLESAYWTFDQRSMQNASDAAALAAAGDATTNYASVASAVAATYGYTDGVNGVTVTSSNAAACPAGGNTCYSVAITYKQQLYLLPIVGFRGDTTVSGGQPAQTLRSTSTATGQTTTRNYCLLALNTIGTSILGNGVPTTNFAGCNTMSNAGSTCNGHDMGADYGDAHLTDNGCGVIQESNVPIVPDPYAVLASNIPANTCGGSYPQEPRHHKIGR